MSVQEMEIRDNIRWMSRKPFRSGWRTSPPPSQCLALKAAFPELSLEARSSRGRQEDFDKVLI